MKNTLVSARVGKITFTRELPQTIEDVLRYMPDNVACTLVQIGMHAQMRKALVASVKKHGADKKKVRGSLVNWKPSLERKASSKLQRELENMSKEDAAKRIKEEQEKLDALKQDLGVES